ncbi:MAG: MopE-related protein [Myxococcota bacterium]
MRHLLFFVTLALLPASVLAQANDIDSDGDGFTPNAGDCNDSDSSVFPGATELCNGVDNDCDGTVDNPPDDDGDGLHECNGDCNDAEATVFTGAPELCDAFDNDCDGDINEGPGSQLFLRRSCYTGPQGTENVGLCVAGFEECSLSSAPFWSSTCQGEVVPVTEVCGNGDDDDCDGSVDEGFDQDGDGVQTCQGDCDDSDPDRYPGNAEVCDGKDNDCSAATRDRDLVRACYTGPAGTEDVGICEAGTENCDGTVFDGVCGGQTLPATETCNQLDDDCDGTVDDGFDADGDGVSSCAGDCDDNDADRFPGNTEVCDGKDNDCSATTRDIDLTRACYGGPAGTEGVGRCVGGTEDCDGTQFDGVCDGDVLPRTGGELCNAIDDDCDGATDEDFDADGDGDPNASACGNDCDDMDANNSSLGTEVCDGQDNDCDGISDEQSDGDGDGVGSCLDCDDSDNSIFPGAPEACNGEDDDCDGDVDEGFADADGDGFAFCEDCNDDDASVRPGANETCNNVDDDCDGDIDERRNGQPLRRSCYTGPAGTLGVGACDDGREECVAGVWGVCDGQVVPEAESCDQIDNDCDGEADEDFDNDDDGFVTCGPNTDCDDLDPERAPGAVEVCDGKDNDCDDVVDENSDGDLLTQGCYSGPDGSLNVGQCVAGVRLCEGAMGFGMMCTEEVLPQDDICDGLDNDCDGEVDEAFDLDEDGFTTCGGDCDDANPMVNPDALELCNAVDDDCDGIVDGAETSCYEGPVGTATVGVCNPGVSLCANGMPTGSCDGQILPGPEICDGLDNDCDGEVDEDFDQDQDGVTSCGGDCDDENPFVAPGLSERCDCADNDCDGEFDETPDGFVFDSVCDFGACHDFDNDGFTNCEGDCEDFDPTAFPGAPEICGDLIDNDCDGPIDEDVDEDGDGITTCGGDCDDRFASIRPEAAELCDGFDNDCDGDIDEGFDQDGDFATICAGDCDDSDPSRSPFRREICGNGIDDDCDGEIDPDDDFDGDGFPICGGDCNDFNAAVHPGAIEVCDAQDNDCNNQVDEGFDRDGDGFVSCLGDCNDDDPLVNPFALELANGLDDNCNEVVDEGDEDEDGDGFTFLCGDCNDLNGNIGPQTTDVCDGIDNDCDGRVDQDPRGVGVCASCNDLDQDGVLDCEGDCDDSDPEVNPQVREICDGKDNSCDGFIDRDPFTLEPLCDGTDLGPRPDLGPAPDAGSRPDSGDASAGAVDAGPNSRGDMGAEELAEAPLELTCGCNERGRSEGSLLPLLGVVGLLLLRRRRRFTAQLVLLVTLPLMACSGAAIDGVPVDRLRVDAGRGISVEDGGQSEDLGPDLGGTEDVGSIDLGPLASGPCRLAAPDSVAVRPLPGARFRLALHDELADTALSAVSALSLDGQGVRGLALSIPLDAVFDPEDFGVAGALLDALIDPLFDRVLPGVTGRAESVDEALRQTFVLRTHPAARTLRRIRMVDAVGPARLRNAIAAELGRQPLGSLDAVVDEEEPAVREFQFAALTVVDVAQETVTFVVALADAEREDANPIIADLSNGTHVGDPGTLIELVCEEELAQALKVDFIWVVDNSASMQEEQEALAGTANAFFNQLLDSRIDFRLGVVTTDGEALRGGGFTRDVESFQERVRVGINGNGREAGLEFALRAVERARMATAEEERLRDDAVTVLVFFSDEDSIELRSVEAYVEALGALDVLPFAIVGPEPRGCTAVGRGIAGVGSAYIRAVEGLGGTSASICASDLTGPIEEILVAAAGAASQLRLDFQPISGTIEVQRENDLTPRGRRDGFDFEPTANSLLFFGDAFLEAGTDFRVAYRRFVPFEN